GQGRERLLALQGLHSARLPGTDPPSARESERPGGQLRALSPRPGQRHSRARLDGQRDNPLRPLSRRGRPRSPALEERTGLMTDPVTPQRSRWRARLFYAATILVTAAATYGVVALLMNINERKQEARQHYVQIVDLNEDIIDPAEWGKNFPREYDGY